MGRSEFLQRYSIPVPVVGGVLFAVATAIAGPVAHVQLYVDTSPKDPLLLAFFATLGLGADVRSLAKGGRKLVVLLLLFVAMMVMQNAIGLGMAWLLDLHPLVGLLGGSISLIGGHGTAAAYAASFIDVRNLQGALELGMAAATAGLVFGSLLAGPVAERIMRRSGERAAAGGAGACVTEQAIPRRRGGVCADLGRAAAVRADGVPGVHRGRACRAWLDEGHRDPAARFPVGTADRHGRAQCCDAAEARRHQRPCRAGSRQRVAFAVPDHRADGSQDPTTSRRSPVR